MSTAKLELIEEELNRIESSRESSDYAEMVNKLPPPIKTFVTREKRFEDISSDLNDLGRADAALRPTAEKLYGRAWRERYLWDVILKGVDIPAVDRVAAIRAIDDKQIASPLVSEALARLAVKHPDLEVRRTAWLQLYFATKSHDSGAPAGGGDRGDRHGNFTRDRMKQLRKRFISERGPVGPRGSIIASAEVRSEQDGLEQELLSALARADGDRKEVALTLSEIGGGEAADYLAEALRFEIGSGSDDESYQVYLASALSNLGGPDAVEGLLHAAETGLERVRLAALSGLESLATAGSTAILEYPEPAVIDSEGMRVAYVQLAKRLSALISVPATSAYVRQKAAELLDAVRISLEMVQVEA